MTMQVILKTGLFALEYGEWHTKPEAQRTWGTLKAFSRNASSRKTRAMQRGNLGLV